jgi:hypothetical protein
MQLVFAATGSAALVASPALWAVYGWKAGAVSLGVGLACGLYLLLEDGSVGKGPTDIGGPPA